MSALDAGRELDAEVAEKVMGLVRCQGNFHRDDFPNTYCYARAESPTQGGELTLYSTDISAAWLVVEAVQKRYPGWRFSLLGGDESWGYTRFRNDSGEDTYRVDKRVRRAFGWRASFFGDEDPTQNSGQRHADEWASTPAHAICIAALKAVAASPSPLAQTSRPDHA